MSETTEIRGTCGHNWLDFAGYAVGALGDDDEFRAVDALADACDICLAELMDVIRVIALLDERFAAKRQQRACPNSWPPRGHRSSWAYHLIRASHTRVRSARPPAGDSGTASNTDNQRPAAVWLDDLHLAAVTGPDRVRGAEGHDVQRARPTAAVVSLSDTPRVAVRPARTMRLVDRGGPGRRWSAGPGPRPAPGG